jgi:hypothetical protein
MLAACFREKEANLTQNWGPKMGGDIVQEAIRGGDRGAWIGETHGGSLPHSPWEVTGRKERNILITNC